jgi:hypothetical protein
VTPGEIVATLPRAQSEAVRRIGDTWATSASIGVAPGVLGHVAGKGLATRKRVGLLSAGVNEYRLTPLGLAVRAILKQESRDG